MTYIIALIVILILIVLFLLLYSPKYKPEGDEEQQETPLVDLTRKSSPAARGETVPAETIEVIEPGDDEHELELQFEEEIDTDDLELDLAPLDETAEELEGVDEFEEAPAAPAEPAPALSSDEPELIEPEELEEEIPFIDEEGEGSYRRSEEVAPALAGFDDESFLDNEETPEDLEERLNFFFGDEDEDAEVAVAEEEQPEEPEEAVEEAAAEEETVAEEAAQEAEQAGETVPEGERYNEQLKAMEEKLRRELQEALDSGATAALSNVELRLMDVCRRQADLGESVATREKLLSDIETVLGRLQEVLPGFQGDAVRRGLESGEGEVVRSLLAEAVPQLENDPALAARIQYLAGRLAEEETAFDAAFDLYQSACRQDQNNFVYAFGAGHLAQLLGNDEEAARHLEHLINAEDPGVDDQMLAAARHDLARVYVRTNQKEKAEPLLQQALEDLRSHHGADYPGLGPVAHDLAALYESSGRYEEAEPLYKQAIDVMEKGWSADYPGLGATLNKLGGLFEEMEREEEAEPLYARALEIKKKLVGENHPDVGTILNSLANLLKLQGKYDKAEPMFLQSLDIAEKTLGKDHPNLAVVLNNLAELYSEMGNEEKAEEYQERAFALFELPGGGGDFVEMEKDHGIDGDEDHDQTIAGS